MQQRSKAKDIYSAAVAAVQPAVLLQQYLSVNENGISINHEQLFIQKKTVTVIGAGKAAAAMAQAAESILGDYLKQGVITTKYDHALPLQKITCIEAAHPVPDEQSVKAVQQTIKLLQQTIPDEIIICLLSGGASALWADVPAGLNLQELQQTFQLLLRSGASIDEMNCIRRHLSQIKGGQLLRYAPHANWFTLIISDVPGDSIQDIASGPTSADATTFADAMHIIDRYRLKDQLPLAVVQHLQKGISNQLHDTVKPGDPLTAKATNIIIGNNNTALQAAKQTALSLGYSVVLHKQLLTGEASDAASFIIDTVRTYQGSKPACFLFGGETTVTVTGNGKGGRNQQLALCALQLLQNKLQRITLLSAGTDGTDGPTDAAGAFADELLLNTVREKELSISQAITSNDAYHFFEKANGLLKTGATQTNVMDIVIVLAD